MRMRALFLLLVYTFFCFVYTVFMHLPRILISSPSSSSGKTTVVCALLKCLMERYDTGVLSCPPAAIKCGPDFIDPLFYQAVIGAKTGNIDLFFTPDVQARSIFAHDTEGCSIAVCEGAMGYYDGIGAASDSASAYETARVLDCPVIFVIDVKGKSLSVCAEINGYCSFREHAAVLSKNGAEEKSNANNPLVENNADVANGARNARSGISGIILNRCCESLFKKLAPVIERECGVSVLGYLEQNELFSIESRHLGLVTPDSVKDIQQKIEILASSFEKTVSIEKIIKTAETASDLNIKESWPVPTKKNHDERIRVAVLRDSAFCFYYRENFDLLESLGAELAFFSALKNEPVPEHCSALYIGGGYPELFPSELASNTTAALSVREFARSGAPVYAECGGFLYLQMIGLIPGTFENTHHLVRFGYCTLTAQRNTIMCRKGDSIRAHEFHYFDTTDNGSAFTAVKAVSDESKMTASQKKSAPSWQCIQSCAPVVAMHTKPCKKNDAEVESIIAGFPHLYFASNESFAKNFVESAYAFSASPKKEFCSHAETMSESSCSGHCETCSRKRNESFEHKENLKKTSLIADVKRADPSFAESAKKRWASIAKPLGSLGVLEDDVCRIAAVQRTDRPDISNRALAVFCADNGIVEEGVTQTGQNVTAVVARNLCTGDTSVCKMARIAQCDVFPVDIGMATPVSHEKMTDFHIARGTKNFLKEQAMTRVEAEEAVKRGFEFALTLASKGYKILATGEMGIGNTTTSSAVVSVLLGVSPELVTGPGAGLSREGVDRKIEVIKKGIEIHHPDKTDAIDVIAKIGGFDIAGMAGFFIGGAVAHVPVIIDGLISAAAALAAVRMCPSCSDALIASHVSSEKAGRLLLDSLSLQPAVAAGMHLGEGTGCMTILPMLDMALAVYNQMATFDDIHIGGYKPL
jgi:cobyrinic acid a,c-diamide synthase